jgi:hypothetical protein
VSKVKVEARQRVKSEKILNCYPHLLTPAYNQFGQVHLHQLIETYLAAIVNNEMCRFAPLGNDNSCGRIER